MKSLEKKEPRHVWAKNIFFFFLPQKPVERVTIPHNQDTNDSLTGSKDALLTRMHRIIYKVMSSARSHLLSLLFPLFIRSKRRTHSHDQSWKTGVRGIEGLFLVPRSPRWFIIMLMSLWNAACYVTVLSGAFQRRGNVITSRCRKA